MGRAHSRHAHRLRIGGRAAVAATAGMLERARTTMARDRVQAARVPDQGVHLPAAHCGGPGTPTQRGMHPAAAVMRASRVDGKLGHRDGCTARAMHPHLHSVGECAFVAVQAEAGHLCRGSGDEADAPGRVAIDEGAADGFKCR